MICHISANDSPKNASGFALCVSMAISVKTREIVILEASVAHYVCLLLPFIVTVI